MKLNSLNQLLYLLISKISVIYHQLFVTLFLNKLFFFSLTVASRFRIATVSRRALALERAGLVDASGSLGVAVVVAGGAFVDVLAGEAVSFEASSAGAFVGTKCICANCIRRALMSSSNAFVLV